MVSGAVQGRPFIIVCGKTPWWRTDWLLEWVAREQKSRTATVGLLYCILGLESEDGDISAAVAEAMRDGGPLPITFLGVWSHLVRPALLTGLIISSYCVSVRTGHESCT